MAETVSERLAAAWARTDRIFELLVPGAFLARPIALRHPFIFYVGHLPAFAWNHICAGVLERSSLNAAFDELFSRGIDPDVDDPAHFGRDLLQRRLDLSEFDPMAPDFDLMIYSTQEFNRTAGKIPSQIACLIETCTRLFSKWMRQKLLGG